MSDNGAPSETPDLILPHDLALNLLHYLAQRPYAEVFPFVAAIQNLLPVPEPQPARKA